MPYANNQGMKIYYEVEGNGPALILLHGSPQDLLHWREFGWTDQLRQDYQLILIDIRGHGASDKPYDEQAYQLELLAQDVLTVLDKLSIRKAHCCGYSYGGWICFQLAKFAPERFHSFVIIGSHPYGMPGDGEGARQAFGAGMEIFLEHSKSPGLLMTPHFKAQKLADDPEAFIANWTHDYPSSEDVLPTMTMPCFVCVGEGGDCYDEAKKCAEHLPNGRFRSFPRLAHGQMLRYSSQVVPHVKEFLDEVTPKAERNRVVIDRVVQALNRGNFLVLDEFYTLDWVSLLPTTNSASKGIRELVDEVFNIFRDAEVVLNDVSAENDQVTTNWTFKGTHTGECIGISPTNAQSKNKWCDG
ncbi:MAG: alpha/beta fold hydrolase [Caldilineaceae bacterium]